MGRENAARLAEIGRPKLGNLTTLVGTLVAALTLAQSRADAANERLVQAQAEADQVNEQLKAAQTEHDSRAKELEDLDSAVTSAENAELQYAAAERMLANRSTADDAMAQKLEESAGEMERYAMAIIEPPVASPPPPPVEMPPTDPTMSTSEG